MTHRRGFRLASACLGASRVGLLCEFGAVGCLPFGDRGPVDSLGNNYGRTVVGAECRALVVSLVGCVHRERVEDRSWVRSRDGHRLLGRALWGVILVVFRVSREWHMTVRGFQRIHLELRVVQHRSFLWWVVGRVGGDVRFIVVVTESDLTTARIVRLSCLRARVDNVICLETFQGLIGCW